MTQHPADVPVGLQAALAKLQRQGGGGLSALLGWSVYVQSNHECLGVVEEVVRQGQPSVGPDGRRTGGAGTLLKARRQHVLQPYGFEGEEDHYIPLDASFVHAVHFKDRSLFVHLPKGFLSLGRRSLCLSFLAQELPQFAQPLTAPDIGRPETRVMPTRGQLLSAGRRDLVDLVLQCGGFSEVAVELGMRSKRRPAGYWDNPEHLDAEIRTFVASQWVELEQPDQQGPGARYYYNLVSERIARKLPGGAVLGDVRRLAQREGAKDRVMPSRSMLLSVGRYDLHHAITAQGGYLEVGATLGRRPPRYSREKLIGSREELQEELHVLAEQLEQQQQQQGQEAEEEEEGQGEGDEDEEGHAGCEAEGGGERGRHWEAVGAGAGCTAAEARAGGEASCSAQGHTARRLPTERQLLAAGRTDVISAVRRYGGFAAVSEASGLQPHRRPRAFWKSLDNVVAEVLQFMEQQQQQQQQQRAKRDSGNSHGEVAGHATAEGEDAEQQRQQAALSNGRDGADQGEVETRGAGKGAESCAVALDGSLQGPPTATPPDRPRHRHLPTQRQLVAAGRQDLLYALQLHGHHKVAQRCGLRPQSRGSHVRKLSYDLVRQALADGHSRPGEIQGWLQERHGATVTRSHLIAFLTRMVNKGLLARVARGTYSGVASPPAQPAA